MFLVDWRQRNSTFFNALQVERNVMFLILTMIVLVAALNIISGLIMLVKDKGSDIAILRTMGLGTPPPDGEPLELGEIRQKSGKRVLAWGVAGDLDAGAIRSNLFSMQWPPRSGQMQEFPEVDRAQWFTVAQAREKLNPAQVELVERLALRLAAR